MGLTRQQVEKVSLLGRLRLSADELDRMTEQLGQIVDYMEQLQGIDTTNIPPMAHALELSNVFREDAVSESLSRDLALANAPKRDSECFLVPAVLGE